jgi:hypothetical protein
MPSKAVSFLLLLVLLFQSACHGKRKAVETISMSHHQRQEVLYHDTLWQQLNISLDGITMEWRVDSSMGKQGTLMRIQAEHAELGTQRQSHTELKVEAHHADTVATHLKVVETNPRESVAGAWKVWGIVVMLLLVIAVVAYLWWRRR